MSQTLSNQNIMLQGIGLSANKSKPVIKHIDGIKIDGTEDLYVNESTPAESSSAIQRPYVVATMFDALLQTDRKDADKKTFLIWGDWADEKKERIVWGKRISPRYMQIILNGKVQPLDYVFSFAKHIAQEDFAEFKDMHYFKFYALLRENGVNKVNAGKFMTVPTEDTDSPLFGLSINPYEVIAGQPKATQYTTFVYTDDSKSPMLVMKAMVQANDKLVFKNKNEEVLWSASKQKEAQEIRKNLTGEDPRISKPSIESLGFKRNDEDDAARNAQVVRLRELSLIPEDVRTSEEQEELETITMELDGALKPTGTAAQKK